MSQEIILRDDITPGAKGVVETVRFGLDHREYEIDLGPVNRRKLNDLMGGVIPYARRAAHQVHQQDPRRTAAGRRERAAVRAWAKANGIPVEDRGRIPVSAYAKYREAQKVTA